MKKLSSEQIVKIKTLSKLGKSERAIANTIGCSRSAVWYQIQKSKPSMAIYLRLEEAGAWSPKVINKEIHGAYTCDVCGSRLFAGPGKIKYCDAVHSIEEVKSIQLELKK